ncbi:putative zinc-binding protein [Desulfobacula sp.]|uniref:putative zinc-binding protein n=1 Tax=Desulfobacula sp. TaxID=2593537 RepID=UPI0026183E96|nr:putative zinc-binding protein [Desulfobacula sp.]
MTKNCCASEGNIMVLACSGVSNVGQLSNQAAIELTREGLGKMFCLAGIGGQLSGFVQSAKNVENMVAIDGCKVECVKAILEQAEVPLKNHVVITNLGIEKNNEFTLKAEDIVKVKSAVLDICSKHSGNNLAPSEKPFNCCG